MNRLLSNRWTKAVVFAACLLPAVLLVWKYQHNQLGINWIEKAQHITGDWTLRFLLLSLVISPLRKLTNWTALIKFRRLLGLYAFFYACLHVSLYGQYDKAWDWLAIREDFTTRRFFTAGLVAFALLVPLALTSTAAAIRWLGGKKWQGLHRLVYISAVAAIAHYYWQGKSFVWTPVIYGAILLALLGYRVLNRKSKPKPTRVVAAPTLQ